MVLDFSRTTLFERTKEDERGLTGKKRLRNWSCNGANFFNSDGADALWDINNGVWTIGSDGIIAIANVSGIPEGAIIEEVIVHGNAAASAETWALRRVNLTTGINELIATANINTSTKSIALAEIDYSKYSYFFKTSTMDIDDEVYGAVIIYAE